MVSSPQNHNVLLDNTFTDKISTSAVAVLLLVNIRGFVFGGSERKSSDDSVYMISRVSGSKLTHAVIYIND